MSAMDKVKGVVAGRQGEAFAVGVSDGRPSVQHRGPGGWSKETFAEDRSGVMKAVASSSGVAIAAGRVNDENGDVDAGMWRRGSNGSWSLNCPDSVCGDTAPGAVDGRQQILDLTVTGTGTFVAVGRESARGQPGQWHPVVWRLNPGTTWSRVEDTGLSTFSGYMTGVVSRGNLLVAVGTHGADGAAWVSNDQGVQWTKKRAAALNAQGKRVEPQAVTVTPEGFFAVGLNRNPPSPVAWFSKNGSAWRRSSIQDWAMGQQIFDVAPTPSGWSQSARIWARSKRPYGDPPTASNGARCRARRSRIRVSLDV